MTTWRMIVLKVSDWAEPVESVFYEIRPIFFLALGLAVIFLYERDLVATLVGLLLIFISGYAVKARYDYRRKRRPQ